MNILVTGSRGFIGNSLCKHLSASNEVIGFDRKESYDASNAYVTEQGDITDLETVQKICDKYSPGVVIHCAGFAHQKLGGVDFDTYMQVNSEATENLAKITGKNCPPVVFIFLSSVSVYGEENLSLPVSEGNPCLPSSYYAQSKLDAENRLLALSEAGYISNLIILRLAPVYDCEWSLNLDRRVFAPGKLAYIKFGSGSQRMSALARPNLIDFIEFIIHRFRWFSQNESADFADFRRASPQVNANENNLCNQSNLRINVCDEEPYEFNRIIKVFKKSDIRPDRPVLSVPIVPVWLAARIAGVLFSNKKEWIHSCYDKLAYDLVFDNGRMMGTGFRPRHSLETIFFKNSRPG